MLLEVSVALFVVYLISFVIQTWLELKKLPHGPIPLPIIGNMHQLGTSPPFSMSELCDKYPNVLRVKTPLGYIVFLNSVEAAREALLTRKTDMAGRPKEIFNSINDILQQQLSIVDTKFDRNQPSHIFVLVHSVLNDRPLFKNSLQ